MRKNENVGPYPQPQSNGETFKQEVFRRDNKIPNLGMYYIDEMNEFLLEPNLF